MVSRQRGPSTVPEGQVKVAQQVDEQAHNDNEALNAQSLILLSMSVKLQVK